MAESLTETLQETLAFFDGSAEPRTTPEVAEHLDLGRRTAYARLNRLVEREQLETKKVGANARVWWRPPTERARREHREEFESLVDAVEEYAIFTLDADGYVRTWNPGAEGIKGYGEDEIVGEHVSTFYTDDDRDAGVPERNLDAAADRGSFRDEGWRVRADGSRFWASVTITAIRGEDGTLQGYAKIVRDMTERRERERRLRRERDLTERLLETAPVRLAVFRADGSVERINSRTRRALGIDESAVSEFGIEDFEIYDADGGAIPPAEHPVPRVLETGEPVSDWLVQHDDPDGDRRWVSLTVTPLFDDGEIERVVVAGRDVTEFKRIELRLQRQRDELESELDEVFERISDGFYALDEDLRFRYLNDHAAAILGLDESVVGRNFLEEVTTTDAFERALDEALESQEPVIFEDYYDPVDRWFHNAIYPSETGLSVYFREITERKQHEQKLERQQELLGHTERLAGTGGWETDLETGEQRWTPGLFEIHDFDPDEADQDDVPTVEEFFSFVAPEHRESFQRAVDRCIEEAEPYDEEIRITTNEGRERWIRTLGVPIEEDDEVVALRGAARDVTERRERERQLSTLIDNVPGMVYRARNERGWPIEFVSDACTELTGYNPGALEHGDVGWGEDVMIEDDRDLVWRGVQRKADSGAAFSETYRIETADGDRRWVRDIGRGILDGAGDIVAVEGIVRDVTEQVERERRLEQYERIVETVDDGIYVLDDDHRFTTVNRGFTSMTGYDRDELLGAPAEIVFGDKFADIATEKQGELESGTQDVAVLEEELYRADGSSFVAESRFDLFDLGADEIGRVGVVRDVTERAEREQELERQHEQLAALDSLSEVVREITAAVIDQSTRERIERAVCEHLADSDSYLFAWIGEPDATTQTVNLRTEAGVEGYLDGITISVDPDDDRSEGPTGRAFRTGEMQTTLDIPNDPAYEPWRETAREHGFRSSAAIPIVHDGTVYGVLNVYAERRRAFEDREGEVIAQLGEIVGHAIAAVERKRALMSDELVELEFRIPNVFTALDVPVESDGRITLDRAIPITDDEFVVYGTATPDALDGVKGLAGTLPHWEAVTVRSEGDPVSFELRLTEPPVLSVVAALGGYVEQLVIEDGTLDMTFHLAPNVDVRRVIDAVTETYPDAEMLRRQQITRTPDDPRRIHRRLLTELTDRQHATLVAAYHAGYFEWPRGASGEEVAESLDIAPPTFAQHLRKAERKAFDVLLSTATPEPDDG